MGVKKKEGVGKEAERLKMTKNGEEERELEQSKNCEKQRGDNDREG